MLASNRIENSLQPYSIPQFSIVKRDIEGFITELQGFHRKKQQNSKLIDVIVIGMRKSPVLKETGLF